MKIVRFIPKSLRIRIKSLVLKIVLSSKEVTLIKTRIEDFDVKLNQLNEALKIYNGLILPPPDYLQKRVVGGYHKDFVVSSNNNIRDFTNALSCYGKGLDEFESILDFGCGCGRILLGLKSRYPHLKISGSDIDSEAISFNKLNYSNFGDFYLNNPLPPSSFEDNTFDLIYGISVFTHLPEDMQFEWLMDLKRITRPGAFLLLTIENKKIENFLTDLQLEKFREKGFVYVEFGEVDGLPEFYKTTLHTHDYITTQWGIYFEILDIIELGSENHQDLVVCRNIK